MIATNGKRVAVTRDHPDFEFRVGNLDTGGASWGAAVDGVKAEGVHVIRKAAGAADAGNDHEIFAAHAEFGEHGLHRGENGVVAAAWAPAHFLVGLKIFSCEGRESGCGHQNLLNSQHFLDFLFEFALLEGASLNFVEADGVDQILCAQKQEQLAHVEFGDENSTWANCSCFCAQSIWSTPSASTKFRDAPSSKANSNRKSRKCWEFRRF